MTDARDQRVADPASGTLAERLEDGASPIRATPIGASPIRVVERQTTRTARYALVGAPPAEARRVWFALHGYGQLAPRFLRHFVGAVPDDTCVVAPEGLSRFYLEGPKADGSHLQRVGATWLTRESRDSEIRDAIGWLDGVHGDLVAARSAPPAVGVLGFSQGVATAMRWIAAGSVRPSVFVAWAGGMATDVHDEIFRDRLRGTRTVVVAGEHDHFVTDEARRAVVASLRRFAPTVDEIVFEGEHELNGPVLARLFAELPANPS